MSLKPSLWQLFDSLMLLDPLILHFGLKVFADLKVIVLHFKNSLYQYLINIFEMNSVYLTLIGLKLVCGQDSENIFVLNKDSLLLIHIERVFVVH